MPMQKKIKYLIHHNEIELRVGVHIPNMQFLSWIKLRQEAKSYDETELLDSYLILWNKSL